MIKIRWLSTLLLSVFVGSLAIAQDNVVRLYAGPAPATEEWQHAEQESRTNLWRTRVVFNVVNPTLTVFQPEPDKANGTVTASVAFNYAPDSRPNFVAPIYPAYKWVVKEGGVPADLPPMFILAATDDPLKLAPESVALYQDWTAARKSAELHLFSKGGHGFGMRKQHLPSDHWMERFADWLEVQGWLKR